MIIRSRAEHCKIADDVLKELLATHFWSKNLEWLWVEGCTLASKDVELYAKIVALYPELIKSKSE